MSESPRGSATDKNPWLDYFGEPPTEQQAKRQKVAHEVVSRKLSSKRPIQALLNARLSGVLQEFSSTIKNDPISRSERYLPQYNWREKKIRYDGKLEKNLGGRNSDNAVNDFSKMMTFIGDEVLQLVENAQASGMTVERAFITNVNLRENQHTPYLDLSITVELLGPRNQPVAATAATTASTEDVTANDKETSAQGSSEESD